MYKDIYKYLESQKGKIVTASGIAYNIKAERIYGATMIKLVRDGYLDKCEAKGFYRVK